MYEYLITNISELATPLGAQKKPGANQNEVLIIKNACIAVKSGRITYVGGESNAPVYPVKIDAEGGLVTPGLVDAHTHPIFGGWREREPGLRLGGASYIDILKNGGGILSTVKATRDSGKAELKEKAAMFFNKMLAHGTTVCEAKSGYGLSLEHEIIQLELLKELRNEGNINLASTFMGAHAIPREYANDRDGYITLLCDEIIPVVAEGGLAEFCDVFCEESVFTAGESRRILKAAAEHGLGLKLHADELGSSGGAELAAELCAISADHLISASDYGIGAMAEKGVIAVLLPATSFYLGKDFARARQMIDAGVAIAIASDFNPGSSPNFNMQFPLTLARHKYRLTASEALTSATLNAAAAINLATETGSVEVGKRADIVIWDAPNLEFLFYRYGDNQAKTVIKNGEVYDVLKGINLRN